MFPERQCLNRLLAILFCVVKRRIGLPLALCLALSGCYGVFLRHPVAAPPSCLASELSGVWDVSLEGLDEDDGARHIPGLSVSVVVEGGKACSEAKVRVSISDASGTKVENAEMQTVAFTNGAIANLRWQLGPVLGQGRFQSDEGEVVASALWIRVVDSDEVLVSTLVSEVLEQALVAGDLAGHINSERHSRLVVIESDGEAVARYLDDHPEAFNKGVHLRRSQSQGAHR